MAMGFSDVLWVFLMVTALQPILKQKLLEMRRLRLLVQLEKRRGSRVIALVHRQETMSFLGFPLYEFMSLFPQPTRTRPSVEYIPIPYRGRQGPQSGG